MTREEQIKQASVEYQISKCPKAIGGDAFADMIYKVNINPSFIAGAEWADKHPDINFVFLSGFEASQEAIISKLQSLIEEWSHNDSSEGKYRL